MITVKKEQLNFLETFSIWSDKEQAFQIKSNSDLTELIFKQESSKGLIIASIPFVSEEVIDYNFDTELFSSLIMSLPSEKDIDITETGITFDSNKYDIKNYSIYFEDMEPYLEIIEKKDKEKINLIDIEKFNNIKASVGDGDLGAVSYQEGNFITSDRINYTSFSVTDFKNADMINFSSDLFQYLFASGIKEVDLYIDDDFYYIHKDNIYIFVMKKDYILPNFFDSGVKSFYDHPYKFTVAKDELKTVINRMKIVSRNNKESRIFFEVKENSIDIKNLDSQFAQESVNSHIDSEIQGITFAISSSILFQVLNMLSGKDIICYCSNDSDAFRAIKIEDETKNNFYVVNLLEG